MNFIYKTFLHIALVLQESEENHIDIEWGVITGQQALAIGWGCPLHAPIQGIAAGMGVEVLGYINYFLPISELAAILVVWLVAIGAYYMASVVLRWIKAVS